MMTQENPAPLIGSKISLVSKKDVRYEGVLLSVNLLEQSLALQNVKSFGTEGRAPSVALEVAASALPFDCLVFKCRDIKNLHVHPYLHDYDGTKNGLNGLGSRNHSGGLVALSDGEFVKVSQADLQTIAVGDLLGRKDLPDSESQHQPAGETQQTEAELTEMPFKMDDLQMAHPAVQATLFFLDSPNPRAQSQAPQPATNTTSLDSSEASDTQQATAQKSYSISPLLNTKDGCWASPSMSVGERSFLLPPGKDDPLRPLHPLAKLDKDFASLSHQQEHPEEGSLAGLASLEDVFSQQDQTSFFMRDLRSTDAADVVNCSSSSLPLPSTLLQSMAPNLSSTGAQPVIARSASSGALSSVTDPSNLALRERQLHELLPAQYRPGGSHQHQQTQEEVSLLRRQIQMHHHHQAAQAQAQQAQQSDMDLFRETTQRLSEGASIHGNAGVRSAVSTPGHTSVMHTPAIPHLRLMDGSSHAGGALPSSVHIELEEKRIRAISLGGMSDYQATREAMLRSLPPPPSGVPPPGHEHYMGSPEMHPTGPHGLRGYAGGSGRGRGHRGRGRGFEGRGGRGRWQEDWGTPLPPEPYFRNGPRESFRGGRGGRFIAGRGMGPREAEDWAREEWGPPHGGPPMFFEREIPMRHRNRGGNGGYHSHGPPPNWGHGPGPGPFHGPPHPGRGDFRGEFEGRHPGRGEHPPFWDGADPHWHPHGPRGPGRGGRFESGRGPRGFPPAHNGNGGRGNRNFVDSPLPPHPHTNVGPPRSHNKNHGAHSHSISAGTHFHDFNGGAGPHQVSRTAAEYYGMHPEMMEQVGTPMKQAALDVEQTIAMPAGQTPRGRAAEEQAQYEAAVHQFDKLTVSADNDQEQSLAQHSFVSESISGLSFNQIASSENAGHGMESLSKDEVSDQLRTSVDKYFGGTNVKW